MRAVETPEEGEGRHRSVRPGAVDRPLLDLDRIETGLADLSDRRAELAKEDGELTLRWGKEVEWKETEEYVPRWAILLLVALCFLIWAFLNVFVYAIDGAWSWSLLAGPLCGVIPALKMYARRGDGRVVFRNDRLVVDDPRAGSVEIPAEEIVDVYWLASGSVLEIVTSEGVV